MRALWILLALLVLSPEGPAAAAEPPDTISEIAKDYLQVALVAHELDPDLVGINDSALARSSVAKTAKPAASEIARDSGKLIDRIDALQKPVERLDAMRLR